MEEKRLIPGTLGYTVDREGNVYNENNNKKPTVKDSKGYIVATVKRKDGPLFTMGQHRALALAFIPNGRPFTRTDVNHKDGVKDNNSLSNLEWVTPGENQIHNEALFPASDRSNIIIYKHGDPIGLACGLKDAAEKALVNYLEVWDCMKDGKITPRGYAFEYLKRDIKPPVELREYKDNTGLSKAIQIKDTTTGEVMVFDSFRNAANYHNTVPSGIYQAIHRPGRLKLLQRRYQIGYADENLPEYSDIELQNALSRGSKPVYAYNTETESYHTFESVGAFLQNNTLSRATVTNSLVKDKLCFTEPWYYIYDNVKNRRILDDRVNGLIFE